VKTEANRVKTVAYLLRGIPDARAFWDLVVLPDVEDFKSRPSEVRLWLHVAWSLWHLHDWLWHDKYPEMDTRDNQNYEKFKEELIAQCPELRWLRDLADAAKHRGLGRDDVQVRQVAEKLGRGGAGGFDVVGPFAFGSGQPQRAITLRTGGTEHWLEDVIDKAVEFWRSHHFPD
jgi:alkylation response protein AidB-like acyl-CoA dehydrogenase